MKFWKVKKSDGGGAVYVNPAAVTYVQARPASFVGTVIGLGGGSSLDVTGSPADVVAALERAAAGLDEAPVDAPAVAERETLPLWERDKDGDWSRGPWVSASAWVEIVGGDFRGHTDGAHSFRRDTAEGAMTHADILASEAGYTLPWDSMVPDLALVAVLGGKRLHVDRTDNEYYGIEPETHESVVLWHRIPVHLRMSARSEALAALARLLRAHGAIVTEAA